MADLISLKHLDDRSDWLKIVMARASSGLHNLSVKLSSKSDKFEQVEHDKLSHSYTDRNITMGILHHYAKPSHSYTDRNITVGTCIITPKLSQPKARYKLFKFQALISVKQRSL